MEDKWDRESHRLDTGNQGVGSKKCIRRNQEGQKQSAHSAQAVKVYKGVQIGSMQCKLKEQAVHEKRLVHKKGEWSA